MRPFEKVVAELGYRVKAFCLDGEPGSRPYNQQLSDEKTDNSR